MSDFTYTRESSLVLQGSSAYPDCEFKPATILVDNPVIHVVRFEGVEIDYSDPAARADHGLHSLTLTTKGAKHLHRFLPALIHSAERIRNRQLDLRRRNILS